MQVFKDLFCSGASLSKSCTYKWGQFWLLFCGKTLSIGCSGENWIWIVKFGFLIAGDCSSYMPFVARCCLGFPSCIEICCKLSFCDAYDKLFSHNVVDILVLLKVWGLWTMSGRLLRLLVALTNTVFCWLFNHIALTNIMP